MELTRREFAAATAGGLSLFSFGAGAVAPPVGDVRHVHLELPAGPYTRAELAGTIADVAGALGLPAPESATALGTTLRAETYPAEFALSLRYPDEVRVVVRATRTHTGSPQLTLRGDRGTTDCSLDCGGLLPLSAGDQAPRL